MYQDTSTVVRFKQWQASDGRVFQGPFAIDVSIIECVASSSVIAVAAVTDSQNGFLVLGEDLEQFLSQHRESLMVMHNAAPQLRLLQSWAPNLDLYSRVDHGLIGDTLILYRLLLLATKGEAGSNEYPMSCPIYCLSVSDQRSLPDDSRNSSPWMYHQNGVLQRVNDLARTSMATWCFAAHLYRQWEASIEGSKSALGYVSSEWLQERSCSWGMFTHNIQLRAAIALEEVSQNGLHVDLQYRSRIHGELQLQHMEMLKVLHKHSYSPTSKRSQERLQAVLGSVELATKVFLPRNDGGRVLSDKKALRPVLSDPFVQALLRERQLRSRLVILRKMDREVLHPTFNLLVKTGRTSSSGEITAQGIPKEDFLRESIVPSPGHVFIGADYVTIDLVALAYSIRHQFGRESAMMHAINSGVDLHRLVACRLFEVPEEEVTKQQRNCAKAINFGLPAGMQGESLRQHVHSACGVDMGMEGVERFIARWHQLFPEMRDYGSQWSNDGRVFTDTGRLRAAAEPNEQRNTVFQGLAADGAKLALWRLHRAGFRVVNFVHDEFLIEVPADCDLTKEAAKIRKHMIQGMQEVMPGMRIEVKIAAMRRWSPRAEAVYDSDGQLQIWEFPGDRAATADPWAGRRL